MYSQQARHAREARRRSRDWLAKQGGRPSRMAVAWVVAGVVVGFGLVGIVVLCVRAMVARDETARPNVEAVEAVDEGTAVAVPIAALRDGRAHWYRYGTRNGRETRFLMVHDAAGQVRAALDACEACFRENRGFRQAGSWLVCRYCGRRVRTEEIGGARGACHPMALVSAVRDGRVVVPSAALEAAASYF